MHTRRQVLGSAALAALAGCVTVNREVAADGGDGGDGGGAPDTESAQQTTVPAGGGGGDPLDSAAIPIVANDIVSVVNARRDELEGLDGLSDTGTLPTRLSEYATAHSKVMQATGEVAIELEGSGLAEQLEDVNCSIPHDEMLHTYSGIDAALVGSARTEGRTPKQVAAALVNAWLDQRWPRGLILADQAEQIATGGALRGTTVLATVIFC